MPGTALLKRDWVKDHVYLVQFPRAGCIPSPSPFALKLETWLRMADIPYTNISNEFTKKSSKGQIPFIEVNGRQVADSNFAITHLTEEFQKQDIDGRLTPMEKSYAKAYHALVEDSLRWVLFYQRAKDNKWLATEAGFHASLSGVKRMAFKAILCEMFRKKLWGVVMGQGMGRHSPEEVVELAKKDLDAMSMMLGNKKFFFGEKPTTLDCTMFGHLAQFLFPPIFSPAIKVHMEESTPNLVEFVNRMKEKYWPDWNEATEKLSMDSNWKK